jgi:hypothetical protein
MFLSEERRDPQNVIKPQDMAFFPIPDGPVTQTNLAGLIDCKIWYISG